MKRRSKHEEPKAKPEETAKPEKSLLGRLQEQLHFIQNIMEFIPIPSFSRTAGRLYRLQP